MAVQQLWSQLHGEARSSYRLYSKDRDRDRTQEEGQRRKPLHELRGLFWAMVSKLSPARRILFVLALVLLFFPGFEFRFGDADFKMDDLSFVGAVILVALLALELADRVTLKRDLEIAKEIQTWLMPAAPPTVPGVEMAFATRPANTVAGDYYDAFLRQSGETSMLLVAVADVAGKSVPAALLMATLQASLRTLADVCADPFGIDSALESLLLRSERRRSALHNGFPRRIEPIDARAHLRQRWPQLAGLTSRIW